MDYGVLPCYNRVARKTFVMQIGKENVIWTFTMVF